jgi:hypothetical protein
MIRVATRAQKEAHARYVEDEKVTRRAALASGPASATTPTATATATATITAAAAAAAAAASAAAAHTLVAGVRVKPIPRVHNPSVEAFDRDFR